MNGKIRLFNSLRINALWSTPVLLYIARPYIQWLVYNSNVGDCRGFLQACVHDKSCTPKALRENAGEMLAPLLQHFKQEEMRAAASSVAIDLGRANEKTSSFEDAFALYQKAADMVRAQNCAKPIIVILKLKQLFYSTIKYFCKERVKFNTEKFLTQN